MKNLKIIVAYDKSSEDYRGRLTTFEERQKYQEIENMLNSYVEN